MLAVLGASDGEALKINLTLFRQMEFSITLNTRMAGESTVYTEGSKVMISKKCCISFSRDQSFLSKQCIDFDEMLHLR